MGNQTKTKANAALLSGGGGAVIGVLLNGLIPWQRILDWSGSTTPVDSIETAFVAVVILAVTWAGTYYAPANRPKA